MGTKEPVDVETGSFGNRTYDYNQLKDILAAKQEVIFWDEEAKAPYYFDGEQFISYDNERSMAEKMNYIKKHHLRGLMYWEHSLDLSGVLLKAATDQL